VKVVANFNEVNLFCIRQMNVTSGECYFWSTQSGAELDLFLFKDGKRLGFEFKYSDAPGKTASMEIALKRS
jgi:hypothetical protein